MAMGIKSQLILMMMSIIAYYCANATPVSSNDAKMTTDGPQIRRVPVRGVLKSYDAPGVSGTKEEDFWHNSAINPLTGEPPAGKYADTSKRREGLERYKAIEKQEEGLDFPKRKSRLVLAGERVRHFAIDAAPFEIQAEEEVVSSIASPDEVGPYAARVLDVLHERFSKSSFHEAQAVRIADVYVSKEVDKCRAVLGKAVSMEDIVVSTLSQTDDLIQRTEARMERLSALQKPQHDVRGILKEIRATAAVKWSEEDEANFIEKALTRVPDVVYQRYLPCRVSTRILGLDANAKSLSALREVAAVMTLLLP